MKIKDCQRCQTQIPQPKDFAAGTFVWITCPGCGLVGPVSVSKEGCILAWNAVMAHCIGQVRFGEDEK